MTTTVWLKTATATAARGWKKKCVTTRWMIEMTIVVVIVMTAAAAAAAATKTEEVRRTPDRRRPERVTTPQITVHLLSILFYFLMINL